MNKKTTNNYACHIDWAIPNQKTITNSFSGQEFTQDEIDEINYDHIKQDSDEAEERAWREV